MEIALEFEDVVFGGQVTRETHPLPNLRERVGEGNESFSQGNVEDALELYSQALELEEFEALVDVDATGAGGAIKACVFSNLSMIYNKLSEKVKARPARSSEASAWNGLDPLQLAERALKYSDKACSLAGGDPKVQGRRGVALYHLEKFEGAREAYQKALDLNKGRGAEAEAGLGAFLEERLKEVEDLLQGARGNGGGNGGKLAADEFECVLCFKMFYDPVTTACGHTFCKSCLLRSQDYGNRCPSCRTVLFITQTSLAVNVTLKNIMQKLFPAEYEQRRKEEEEKEVSDAGSGATVSIPLFVMDVVLPFQRLALNIFEPRYRLLIRRAMAGSRTFGMIGLSGRSGDILGIGVEVKIEECQCMPDGRFHIEVVGGRRFKVLGQEEQDGYRLAQAKYIRDEKEYPDTMDQGRRTDDVKNLFALAQQIEGKLETFLGRIGQHSGRQHSAVLNALKRSAGKKPQVPAISEGDDDERANALRMEWAEDISMYVATFLATIHVVNPADVLEMQDTGARLMMLDRSTVMNV